MARRLFDVTLAAMGLIVLAPLFVMACAGIRAAGDGPILYRATRVGRNRRPFTLYKFRTMRTGADRHGPITGAHDARVFPFGAWLRKWKVDELPQLVNVLKGEMSIVGPRPEDPLIVKQHYSAADLETLRVAPGLASPGSIYNYTHGERLLAGPDVAAAYAERLLPVKLALERVYLRRASFAYDLRIIGRTMYVLCAMALGRRIFPDPPEMAESTVPASNRVVVEPWHSR